MSEQTIPLFPLHTVLFPGGALPLRVFEPRYLDMISSCMRNGSHFGVILISEGSEVGKAAKTYPVGTLGEITYFQQLKDGCLGITVRGVQRFNVRHSEVQPNELTVATVELIPQEARHPLPACYARMQNLLEEIFNQLGQPFTSLPKDYDDACWVSSRLAELLPISLMQKQALLQLDDPLHRLQKLDELLAKLDYR
ncbi:MAG: LON peptidase substrate-binding domain-containing protein [Pseudomonadota bacterium]